MSETDKLPLNETGTHVLTVAPSGVPWECPIDYLEIAKGHGYTVVGAEKFQTALDDAATAANPFNPDDHKVAEVNKHLENAFAAGDVEEVQRVLEAEAAGQNRSTVTDPTNA